MNNFYVYLMTNYLNTVIYAGVTNDLKRRIFNNWENKIIERFTKKYNINKLVYYEIFDNAYNAISREKQIKAGSREKKADLIISINPEWKDLYFKL